MARYFSDEAALKRQEEKRKALATGGDLAGVGTAIRHAAGAIAALPGEAYRGVVRGYKDSGFTEGVTSFMAPTGREAATPQATVAAPVKKPQAANQSAAGGFSATIQGKGDEPGIRYTADAQGNRAYTMGTPGQVNYGVMKVAGRQPDASQQVAGGLPQQQAGAGRGYSFEGSQEDANRFFAPVSGASANNLKGPLAGGSHASFMAQRAQEQAQANLPKPPNFSGMTAPQRRIAQREYDNALGLAEFRENTGASRRRDAADAAYRMGTLGIDARRAATGEYEADIDRQRLAGELGMNALNAQEKQAALGFSKEIINARRDLSNAQPGTPEYEQALRRVQGLTGEDTKEKPNIMLMEDVDPLTGEKTKYPIQTYNDQTYARLQERGMIPLIMANINADPDRKAKFDKMSPEERQAFIKKLGA